MTTMEMLGRARATRSNSSSESIASATSTRIFISMNLFFTSLLIPNGGTQLMRSIYCTFHTMWMKWFQTASRNPTSLRSPQTGASAVSTLSLSGKKQFKNLKVWVRAFYSSEDVYIREGDFYVSWIFWDIGEKEQLVRFLFRNSWWLGFSGDTFSEEKWVSHFHSALLTWSLYSLLISSWGPNVEEKLENYWLNRAALKYQSSCW